MYKAALIVLSVCSLSATTLLIGNPVQASVINGNFESGNTGFSSDYSFISGNNTGPQQYGIVTNPAPWNSNFTSFGDHTTGTGNMMIVNGSTSSNQRVWEQTISVITNTTYNFSSWIANASSQNPSQLEFLINSIPIGSFTASSTPGLWEEFSATWNSGIATSANITIIETSLQLAGNDFALDDISLTTTPEPATILGLLAVGSIEALARKRK